MPRFLGMLAVAILLLWFGAGVAVSREWPKGDASEGWQIAYHMMSGTASTTFITDIYGSNGVPLMDARERFGYHVGCSSNGTRLFFVTQSYDIYAMSAAGT